MREDPTGMRPSEIKAAYGRTVMEQWQHVDKCRAEVRRVLGIIEDQVALELGTRQAPR